MTATIEQLAIKHWKSGEPVDAAHPHEERCAGDTLLVPLYLGDEMANVLSIAPGKVTTFAADIHPPNRRTPTRARAKTLGAVAVAGRPQDDSLTIPGSRIDGAESRYAEGRLAGASRIFLTVGWHHARRLFAATGVPTVATLEGALAKGQGDNGAPNLIGVALELRRTLPAEVAITLALPDDRTPESREQKRLADIAASQAEREAAEIASSQNSKEWKRQETQEQAETLRLQANAVTLFDAAIYAAEQIGARLVALDDDAA